MTNQPIDSRDGMTPSSDADATKQMPAVGVGAGAAESSPFGDGAAFSSVRVMRRGHGAVSGSGANDGEVLIRKKRRRNTKRKRTLRIVGVVALVLALVVGGTAFAAWQAVKAGENSLHQTADAQDIQTADDSVAYDEGRTVKYNGHTYKLNENMVSVVIMGYDRTEIDSANGQNGQADAVMVMALDTQTPVRIRCSCALRSHMAMVGREAPRTSPPPFPACCITCP